MNSLLAISMSLEQKNGHYFAFCACTVYNTAINMFTTTQIQNHPLNTLLSPTSCSQSQVGAQHI